MRYDFASDNAAGICPEAWAAMAEANAGFAPSYGNDQWTAKAADQFRDLFESRCEVFFVFNGTAANSLALATLCQSYHSVICHETAHIETDECGAPEFFSNGTKILTTRGAFGKLDPAEVTRAVTRRTDIHYPKPHALSLTQSTELGTIYTPDDLHGLWRVARDHGLSIHMDGARFANALVSLDVPARRITWEAGVDVLCLGGTKLGIGTGEAVVFFNHDLARDFEYRCKQAGQLASGMRFHSAPWAAMLANGHWLDNARHANRLAKRLADGLRTIPDIEVLHPVEANGVFARLGEALQVRLKSAGWVCYNFIGGGTRFMCSWRTSERDVDELLACLRGQPANAGG